MIKCKIRRLSVPLRERYLTFSLICGSIVFCRETHSFLTRESSLVQHWYPFPLCEVLWSAVCPSSVGTQNRIFTKLRKITTNYTEEKQVWKVFLCSSAFFFLQHWRAFTAGKQLCIQNERKWSPPNFPLGYIGMFILIYCATIPKYHIFQGYPWITSLGSLSVILE